MSSGLVSSPTRCKVTTLPDVLGGCVCTVLFFVRVAHAEHGCTVESVRHPER